MTAPGPILDDLLSAEAATCRSLRDLADAGRAARDALRDLRHDGYEDFAQPIMGEITRAKVAHADRRSRLATLRRRIDQLTAWEAA